MYIWDAPKLVLGYDKSGRAHIPRHKMPCSRMATSRAKATSGDCLFINPALHSSQGWLVSTTTLLDARCRN